MFDFGKMPTLRLKARWKPAVRGFIRKVVTVHVFFLLITLSFNF